MASLTSCSSDSRPIALAYAVAALQGGSDLLQTKRMMQKESALTGFETAHSPQSLQAPGSGSDPRMDKPSSQKEFEDDESAGKRLARSRERNREHARKTRLRKKAQLDSLQGKVKDLEADRQVLKQQIEECSIASILLGLSSGEQDEATQNLLDATSRDTQCSKVATMLCAGKRKRFLTDSQKAEKPAPALQVNIDGQMTVITGGKTHINWKTGVFTDVNGEQKQLTAEELENLR
jgi:hypothetical protein